MDFTNHPLKGKQYSTVINPEINCTVQYSVEGIVTIFNSLRDVIPQDDGYLPFYVKRFNDLGYERFMTLVSKARAGSDTPQKLFSWMLKNNGIVR